MAVEPNGTYALFPSVLKKKKREENQLPVTVAIEQERVVLAWTIGLASCIKAYHRILLQTVERRGTSMFVLTRQWK